MKLIERVFYSIKEKPVKSLLILLVVCLLGTFMSASFSIYQASNNLMHNIRKNSTTIVLIDWESRDKDGFISLEDEKSEFVEKYKNDDRFKFVENRYELNDIDLHFQCRGDNGKLFLLTNTSTYVHLNENETKEIQGLVDLIGIDNYRISDVVNANIEIEIGRTFTEEEMKNGEKVAFYSATTYFSVLADEFLNECNAFVLTPFVVLYDLSGENMEWSVIVQPDSTIELKNIGSGFPERSNPLRKYHSESNETSYGLYIPATLMDQISTDIRKIYEQVGRDYPWFKNQSNFEDYGKKYVSETYVELNDAEQLTDIVREIEKETKGLVKGVYSFADTYNDIKSITKNLNTIAIVSLVVCAIASIFLLSLIFQIFVRERRHEIGIFISLGENKKNIITQVLLEVLIIGMLGISLSMFSGHMIGKGLSQNLLDEQLKQHEEVYSDLNNEFGMSEEEIKEGYEITITYEYILSVYVGGLVVLALSCIYPTRSILKMKARKMLM